MQEAEDYLKASIKEGDEKNMITKAEKKGREEGRKKGREEGRDEGREEGEKKKALDVAKRAKAKGMDIIDIIELTGLSKEEIEKL
jgi:predicted transposase YdaD